MVRVHRPVQQAHAFHAHRGHNGFDTPGVPALREVRNALDYCLFHLYLSTRGSIRIECGLQVYFQNVYPTCT